jgi:threonine aldolase
MGMGSVYFYSDTKKLTGCGARTMGGIDMIRFESDYLEGAHPKIMERLAATGMEQTPGYGEDVYCQAAREKIQALCGGVDCDVQFLVGGTQTNLTVIAAALRPYQGVLSAQSGHINVHETGAIEATGHKVLPLPSEDGKITAQQIEDAVRGHWADSTHEHLVQPGMVYLSHPTENGTLYTRAELTEISRVCRERDLFLYVDGARLGYGLVSPGTDLTLPDLARLCSAFYIGGTKVGALFGEAVVLIDPRLRRDFRYMIKQRGGMLAKGRLLGLQFDTLFTENLYFDIARHAVEQALRLRRGVEEKGWTLRYDSWTNLQFPVVPDTALRKLSEQYSFSHWEKAGPEYTVVRICTSWATEPEVIDQLLRDIQEA